MAPSLLEVSHTAGGLSSIHACELAVNEGPEGPFVGRRDAPLEPGFRLVTVGRRFFINSRVP